MKTFFIVIGILGNLMLLISATYFCFFYENNQNKKQNFESQQRTYIGVDSTCQKTSTQTNTFIDKKCQTK